MDEIALLVKSVSRCSDSRSLPACTEHISPDISLPLTTSTAKGWVGGLAKAVIFSLLFFIHIIVPEWKSIILRAHSSCINT